MDEVHPPKIMSNKKKRISEIEETLLDIEKHKNFTNSLPFLLTSLKNRLIKQNFLANLNSALEMIDKNIIPLFEEILINQKQNSKTSEKLCIQLGDILLEISKILIKESSSPNNHSNYFNELLVKKHNLLNIVSSVLNEISVSKEGAIKIFFEIYCELIMYDLTFNNNESSIEQSINFFSVQLNRCSENTNLIINILEIFKKIINNKTFETYMNKQDNNTLYKGFVQQLFTIVSKEKTISQIPLLGLQIIDLTYKYNKNEEYTNIKPFNFFFSIIFTFQDAPSLCFYACRVFSQMIEENLIRIIILILSCNTIQKLNQQIGEVPPQTKSYLDEIKKMAGKYEQSYLIMRHNITRILLLITKDNNSTKFLNNPNIFECFLDLLKADIFELEKTEKCDLLYVELIKLSLPNLIRLIINLVKDVQFEQESSLNKTLLAIVNNFCKILKMLPEEQTFIEDIISFFNAKCQSKELNMEIILSSYKKNKDNIDKIFTELLKRYYKMTILYSFLYKANICEIYPNLSGESPFIVNLQELEDTLNGLELIYKENLSFKLVDLINSLALKLIIGNSLKRDMNYGFDIMFLKSKKNKHIKLPEFFTKIYNKLINLVINRNPRSTEIYNDNNIIYIMTLAFSTIENVEFCYDNNQCNVILNENNKCEFVTRLFSKLLETQTLSYPIINYLYVRLSRLVECKLTNAISIIFNDENLIVFIILGLNMYKTSRTPDIFLKELLTILYQIFIQSTNEIQIVKFIQKNGLISLMKIIIDNPTIDTELSSKINQNFNVIASKNVENTCLLFNEGFYLNNMLNFLKNIKFNKGVNPNVYNELMLLFKQIFQIFNFYDHAEKTNIVAYFLGEYNDIFTFYNDTTNKTLEIINDIITIMCLGTKLLINIYQTDQIITLHNQILSKMLNKETFNSHLFENIIMIESSLYKLIDHEIIEIVQNIYKHQLNKDSYQKIQTIIIDNLETAIDIEKVINLIEYVIIFENELKLNEDIEFGNDTPIFSVDYLKQLKNVFSKMESNPKFAIINERIDNIIEKPETLSSRNLVKTTEEIERMRKDLIAITNERKNLRVRTRELTEINSAKHVEKNRSLSIINNPTLKNYFFKVSNIFKSSVKLIPMKYLNKQDISSECKKLSDNLTLWKYFLKDNDNVRKMFNLNILDNLLIIIESDTIFTQECQEKSLFLVERLIENEIAEEYIYTNPNFMNYIIREFQRISKYYEEYENIENTFKQEKMNVLSKIICQLTENETFLKNNLQKITKDKVHLIISNDNCNAIITEYFLKILKNISQYQENHVEENANENQEQDQEQKTEENEKLCDLLLNQLWNKFPKEMPVLKSIMTLILSKHKDTEFIKLSLDKNILEYLCQVFINSEPNGKKNSDGFLQSLELLNLLSTYNEALGIILDIGIFPVLTAASENMFNKEIIELALSFFLKCIKADKQNISKVCISNMPELTLKILSKYLGTCHVNVFNDCLELIKIFINEEKFSNIYLDIGINELIKSFDQFIQNESTTSLILDILNKIIEDDISAEIINKQGTVSNLGKRFVSTKITRTKTKDKVNEKINDNNEVNKDNLCSLDKLIVVFGKLFRIHFNNIDILSKSYILIKNITKTTPEMWIHYEMFNIFLTSGEILGLNPDSDIDKIKLFSDKLLEWINKEQKIIKQDLCKIICVINEIINIAKIDQDLLGILMNIIYFTLSNEKLKFQNQDDKIYKELCRFFMFFINDNCSFRNFIPFSRSLSCLCNNHKNDYSVLSDLSEKTLKFLLTFLQPEENDQLNQKMMVISDVLKDSYILSKYYNFKSKENANELYNLVLNLFYYCIKNKNDEGLISLFQILIVFSHNNYIKEIYKNNCLIGEKSDYIEKYLKYTQTTQNIEPDKKKIMGELPKIFLNSINSVEDDSQDNGQNNDELDDTNETNRELPQKLFYHLSNNEITFLTSEHKVYFHTDDGKTKKCYLKFNKYLDKMGLYEKIKNDKEVKKKKMAIYGVETMNSVVKNCDMPAFTNKKFKLFGHHKPNPKNCFSIMGIKQFYQPQQNIHLECVDEETCLMYVDIITKVINNYKMEVA